MILFEAADSHLFFKKNDPLDLRLGDLVRHSLSFENLAALQAELKQSSPQIYVAGYPDDEGIRINNGRPGAALAPDAIRTPFYKMTPSILAGNDVALTDLGNLSFKGAPLQERHEFVAEQIKTVLQAGSKWIGLGGGHDYGFADASGFIESCPTERPLIINFDAHLDVRPPTNGFSSGTPFYRMLDKYPDVDFAEIGIQAHCNSKAHLTWAKNRGARVLHWEALQSENLDFTSSVLRLLDSWALKKRKTFLSIDIDAFSSAVAMGASQSWATGLMPDEFFACLQVLLKRLDVCVLSIYEVSPPLDQDNRTAKLAAQILHRFLYPL